MYEAWVIVKGTDLNLLHCDTGVWNSMTEIDFCYEQKFPYFFCVAFINSFIFVSLFLSGMEALPQPIDSSPY